MRSVSFRLGIAAVAGLALLWWFKNESQMQRPKAENTPRAVPKDTESAKTDLVDGAPSNNLTPPAQPPSIDDLWAEALSIPSDHKLIMEAFRKKGGVVKQAALEKDIDSIVRDQFNNDRSAFVADLESKGLTLDEFKRQRHDFMAVHGVKGDITRGITDPILKKEKEIEWLRNLRKSASPGAAADPD